ncbi:hypothetical protein FSHL1_006730 [Fusarium sambucinum]
MKWFKTFISLLMPILFMVQCQPFTTQKANIRHISTIQDVRFSIDPSTLGSLSSFDLDFRLSRNVTRIRFHLQLRAYVVNFDADAQYLGLEGSDEFLDILENPTFFFVGDTLLLDSGQNIWRKAGLVRIMIDPLRPFLFEGFYDLDGNRHHVLLDSSYRKTRLPDDPHSLQKASSHMVVWNEEVVVFNERITSDL